MKKQLFLSLLLLAPTLGLADPQIITLKDGSQIKGELIGVNNGIYTVRTATMGDVQVNNAQVNSISAVGAVPVQAAAAAVSAPAANNDMSQKIGAMQTQLMANPAFMNDVQAMVQDPEIVQLLSDPALMQAVTSKDPNALQNNPRGQALMNNPKVRALIEKLQSQNSTAH